VPPIRRPLAGLAFLTGRRPANSKYEAELRTSSQKHKITMKLLLTLLSAAIFCAAVPRAQDDELAKSIERGKMIYSENCISCHMGTGEGITATFPPLAKSDYLMKTPENAIQAIKFGLIGKVTVNGVSYDNMMPEPGLANDQIADVMNYIMNSWGNSSEKKMITVKMVEAVEEKK
jgi:mono/diheme cytochrome c family protein